LIDQLLEWATRRHAAACLFLTCLALAITLPGLIGLFPIDRDEPRFAQASKQMLESGDFVDIRFHNVARNKKPAGIYWMQAGSVALGELLGATDARTAIWLYRLPSVLGTLSIVLLTYWSALALTTRRGALTAALLLAPAVDLVVESHLAKTDAVLSATVVAAMAVLARCWMQRTQREPLSWQLCIVFWTAIAVGILLKGPITPMMALLAGSALCLRHGSARWLTHLRPWSGVAWCLLLVLPWFVLIFRNTGMAFFNDAVGHDLAGKIGGGQEGHGAPPGFYLFIFWLMAWPLAPFAALAAPAIWRERWSDSVVFLLAWLGPSWLLFEAVPTKLPNYVLPVYPAIAILVGFAAERSFAPTPIGPVRLSGFALLLAFVPTCILISLPFLLGHVSSRIDASTIVLAIVVALAAFTAVGGAVWGMKRSRPFVAALSAAIASVALCGFLLGWCLTVERADLIAVSPRLVLAARAALDPRCRTAAYATVGDEEPSLVFLTGTDLLMTNAAGAAAFMAEGSCRSAFVEQPYETLFLADLRQAANVRLASRVAGFNINGGRRLDIGVYVTAP
jgi:4-amino-4-deoxy-L-arabinose transferase-like glycosyltransferase